MFLKKGLKGFSKRYFSFMFIFNNVEIQIGVWHFCRCPDWCKMKESKVWPLWNTTNAQITPAWVVFLPNLFRGQRAMMHIPESSSGETFHPLFVIVHSCKQSLLPICHIHGSSDAIFFINTRKIEVKLLQGRVFMYTYCSRWSNAAVSLPLPPLLVHLLRCVIVRMYPPFIYSSRRLQIRPCQEVL